jgi:hypothetical protein
VTSRRRALRLFTTGRRPICARLPHSRCRRAREGRRLRRGARNLCTTFHQPRHSAPMVPTLPGADRPLAPPPLGSAGGRQRGSLNGASGAGGLRCGRGLPKFPPRSSALRALRSGPLVKAVPLAAVVDHARGLTPRASSGGGSAPPATLTRGRSGWSGPSTTSFVRLENGGWA